MSPVSLNIKYIIFYLLGIVTSISIIFLFLYYFLIISIEFKAESSIADWLSAIGSVSAALAALTIAIWGKSLKNIFYKPNLELLGAIENIQNNQGHTRLIFKNQGNATAEEVEAYVNNVTDNGVLRAGFLPVPLSWTHNGWPPSRSFHPNQVGYLDLCRRDDINDLNSKPILVLAAGAGVPLYQDIYSGETKIKLVVYQKSGQVIFYELILKWQLDVSYVHLEKFTQLNG